MSCEIPSHKNPQLTGVNSDVAGAAGRGIVRAIVAREGITRLEQALRDAAALAPAGGAALLHARTSA